MATLSDVVESVSDQLSRYDLDTQISREVGLSCARYSRKLTYLTEVRGGTMLLDPGVMWYPTVNFSTGTAIQSLENRRSVPVTNILNIAFVRTVQRQTLDALLLENGGPLLTEDEKYIYLEQFFTDPNKEGLWDTLRPLHYREYESDLNWMIPRTRYGYAIYAGQLGIWPDLGAGAVYISASVKPLIPDQSTDKSVFFTEARELIEAAAAKAVCAKYLMDVERAAMFGAIETQAFTDLQEETNMKASTGRIAARW